MPSWEGIEDGSFKAHRIWLARPIHQPISESKDESTKKQSTNTANKDIWKPLRKSDCHLLNMWWDSQENSGASVAADPATTDGKDGSDVAIPIEGGRATAYPKQGIVRYNFYRGADRELCSATWFIKDTSPSVLAMASSSPNAPSSAINASTPSGNASKKNAGSSSATSLPLSPETLRVANEDHSKNKYVLVPVIDQKESDQIELLYQWAIDASSSLGEGISSVLNQEVPLSYGNSNKDDEKTQHVVKVVKNGSLLVMRRVQKGGWFPNLGQQQFDLQRGYGEYSIDGEWEESVLGPVRHLVFVVHGIGEALFSREEIQYPSHTAIVNKFRLALQRKQIKAWNKRCKEAAKAVAGQQSESVQLPPPNRIEVIPIEWFNQLHDHRNASIMRTLQMITLPTIPALRGIANDVLMDILLYMTPQFCQDVLECVTQQINDRFNKFQEIHPDFSNNGGKCSIIGHSLGSIISWDLLSILKDHIHRATPMAEMPRTRPGDIFEGVSIASKSSVQVGYGNSHTAASDDMKNPNKKDLPRGTWGPTIINHLDQTIPFIPEFVMFLGSPVGVFLSLRGAHAVFNHLRMIQEQEEKQGKLEVKDKRPEDPKSQQDSSQSSSASTEKSVSTEKEKAPSQFGSVRNLFQSKPAMSSGDTSAPTTTKSPAAAKQQGKEAGKSDGKGDRTAANPPKESQKVVPVSPFTLPASSIYNIFHPSDPVAYRIEPLLMQPTSPLAGTGEGQEQEIPPPVYLTSPGKDVRLHLKAMQLTDEFRKSLEEQKNAFHALFESAASAFGGQTSASSTAAQKTSNNFRFPLGGRSDRVDYSLQTGVIDNEYLSAITAHSNYFINEDFQDFCIAVLEEAEEN